MKRNQYLFSLFIYTIYLYYLVSLYLLFRTKSARKSSLGNKKAIWILSFRERERYIWYSNELFIILFIILGPAVDYVPNYFQYTTLLEDHDNLSRETKIPLELPPIKLIENGKQCELILSY
jgi:hypothetical protein